MLANIALLSRMYQGIHRFMFVVVVTIWINVSHCMDCLYAVAVKGKSAILMEPAIWSDVQDVEQSIESPLNHKKDMFHKHRKKRKNKRKSWLSFKNKTMWLWKKQSSLKDLLNTRKYKNSKYPLTIFHHYLKLRKSN